MKTYVTSDLHFGHANILKFCSKSRARFPDVESMTGMMIAEWNDIVQPGDTVYILGDVAFCNTQKAVEILRSLSGRKILIEGNHDRKLLKDPGFRACFAEIHPYLSVNYAGHKIVMFHYPIAEWDQMHRGALHLHGHLHGNKSGMEKFRCRDMGMDATGQIVLSMEEAIASAVRGEIKSHHGKYELA